MKKILLIHLFILTYLLGQTKPFTGSDSLTLNKKKHSALSLMAGSNGFGLQLAKQLSLHKNFNIRANATYGALPLSNAVITVDGKNLLLGGNYDKGFKLNLNGQVLLSSTNLSLDFHPFDNAFRFFGGCGLVFSNITFTATPRDSLRQGDVSLSPEEQGNIYFSLKTQRVCPFIGFGLGRNIPTKRVNLSADFGTYYIGSPKLRFYTTGMLEPTSTEEARLKNNIKNYYLLPFVSINLNIRISK